jgi:hypothetical protein
VLSCVGRGLCDGLITRPEESYRVSVCVWSRNPEKGGQRSVLDYKRLWGKSKLSTWEFCQSCSYNRKQTFLVAISLLGFANMDLWLVKGELVVSERKKERKKRLTHWGVALRHYQPGGKLSADNWFVEADCNNRAEDTLNRLRRETVLSSVSAEEDRRFDSSVNAVSKFLNVKLVNERHLSKWTVNIQF